MVHGGGRHHHGRNGSSRDNNNDDVFQSGSHGVGRHPSRGWGSRHRRPQQQRAGNTVVIVNTGGSNIPRGAGGWRAGASPSAESGPPPWWRHHGVPADPQNRVDERGELNNYNSNSNNISSVDHHHGNEEDDYLIRHHNRQPDGLWTDEDEFDDHDLSYRQAYVRATRKTPNYRCIGLVVSILVTTVLLALSGIRTTWILNAGESRRIETPILSRQITVSARSSINKNVLVYDLADCPPLTGPPVTLQDEVSMSLHVDEYQYDYFFLNAGSSLNVTVHQRQGSSELFILEGSNALRRLQTPSAADSDPFGKDAVVTGFASADSNVSLSHRVGRSDVYTIVYDNPSSSDTSVLQAQYTAILTTYDLQGYAPICRDLQKDCHIHRPERGSCLLVQAPKQNKRKNPNENLVTVKVRGQRRWLPILVFAIIPYLIGLLARKVCKPKIPYQMVHPNEQQAAFAASAPMADEDAELANPPPTAPHAAEQESALTSSTTTTTATTTTPSAPPADEDVPVVAQALTSVEVAAAASGGNDDANVPMVHAQVMAAGNDWDDNEPSGAATHKLT